MVSPVAVSEEVVIAPSSPKKKPTTLKSSPSLLDIPSLVEELPLSTQVEEVTPLPSNVPPTPIIPATEPFAPSVVKQRVNQYEAMKPKKAQKPGPVQRKIEKYERLATKNK